MKHYGITDHTDRRMVLHTCCAPCGTASAHRLLDRGFEVILFFSNSNIATRDEYERRLESARKLADVLDLSLKVDTYDHQDWLDWIKGLEKEPEKGRRCERCFAYSLRRTAAFTRRIGFPYFTTTLTISPHKISRMIFDVGGKFPSFRAFDFKKQDGFKQSLAYSREYALYRQNYCGCEFSRR
jgi:hypothetical protein